MDNNVICRAVEAKYSHMGFVSVNTNEEQNNAII